MRSDSTNEILAQTRAQFCQSWPSLPSMVRGKGHYRGGYYFVGLLELARDLRRRQTPAETVLWQLLRNRQLLGFKFRRQHQFGDYIADFYCREAELVVECDGAVHESNEQWHHDQKRDAYLIGQGLRVLRFTNSEILEETERVIERIAQNLDRFGKKDMCHTPSP